jgi:acyl-CoA dehydrogenase
VWFVAMWKRFNNSFVSCGSGNRSVRGGHGRRNGSSYFIQQIMKLHTATSSDLNDFRETLRRWVKKEIIPNLGKWEKEGRIPRHVYREAAQIGVFASGYPVEYGGLGNPSHDFTYQKIVIEELCQAGSGGFLASLCTHSISLPPIVNFGQPTLKQQILPSVLSGESVCALCVTEPSGGSDVANLQTTATLQPDGTFLLNGIKTFITSGVQADFYTIAARTAPTPAPLSSSHSSSSSQSQPYHGISLFAIPSTLIGITKTPLNKMGWLCSDTATIYFDSVVIPPDSLLGTLHEGFPLLMKNFNSERILLSLQSFFFSRLLYNSLIDYSKTRLVFQKSLLANQVIQHQLIDLYSSIYATETILTDVLMLYEKYATSPVETSDERVVRKALLRNLIVKIAILKNFSTDTFHATADRAVQIMGGAGYMRDDLNVVERLYRETKVMQIGGGSTEVMKELIGKYLGLHSGG